MREDIVKIDNVSMKFILDQNKIKSLKEFVVRALSKKLKYEDFWALRNVSFDVDRGDVIGVIGRNGSGKSTILKCIAGIYKPTQGTITVKGNIVPMLELGSGFDMEMTGKENIFLNGAILGYSKEFLESKYYEIVEFSELGNFIYEPIRTYSSGMLMRLAFSIATVVNPEILIVDEILAVGDAQFQKKSRARMMDLMGGGTTVFFVSHDIKQIREMCNKVVWLNRGELKMIGATEAVCDAYEEWNE
ncbi:MAG: ABC transporter ATP-binding protein [Alistipes sp.]|nr:ABC transporter ATP-binding protein [Alistipes sp.]